MNSAVYPYRQSAEVIRSQPPAAKAVNASVYAKLLGSRGDKQPAPSTGAVRLGHAWSTAPANLPAFASPIWGAEQIQRPSLPHAFIVNWALLHERSGFLPEVFSKLLLEANSPKRVRGEFAPLSAAALSSFAFLWASVKDYAAAPVVSITPAGGIVAEWFMDPDNSLVVLCDRHGEFAFSVFRDGEPLEDSRQLPQLAEMIDRIERHAAAAFTWTEP